ncbi:MAG: hypothetical protein ACP5N7_05905 [Candidatus Pacearchaeota archaeon]
MNNNKLPRGYISYSAYKLWKTSKDSFRKRYYENEEPFETIETKFGKKIAEWLESDDPRVRHVPNYLNREYDLDKVIEGTRVIGRLDGFDKDRLKFLDHKSSHCDKDGKPPWNKAKVRQLDQLPFYSMLIKEIYGKVDNVCHLIWIETEFQENTIEFNGHILKAKGRELYLTGKVKKFRRVIREWERKKIKEDLLKVIKEIEEDYEAYKRNKEMVLTNCQTRSQEESKII